MKRTTTKKNNYKKGDKIVFQRTLLIKNSCENRSDEKEHAFVKGDTLEVFSTTLFDDNSLLCFAPKYGCEYFDVPIDLIQNESIFCKLNDKLKTKKNDKLLISSGIARTCKRVRKRR